MCKKQFPQEFIDYLLYEEDKKRALEGSLKSKDKVWFICPRGHKTCAVVGTKISFTTMRLIRNICGICGREEIHIKSKNTKNNKRFYPQWFIDELIEESDKESAKKGTLTSKQKVKFRYSCGHEDIQNVGDRINISTGQPKHGCPKCGIKERFAHRSQTLSERRSYPDWFIEDLYDSEVKERAMCGDIPSGEEVLFKCKQCGNIYKQLVHNHIKLSTQENRWFGCPECLKQGRSDTAKEYKKEKRIEYPKWFLDIIEDPKDRERATNKILTSTETIKFRCPVCNEVYEQRVGNKINLSDGSPKHGCPLCSFKKIGDIIRSYRESKRSYPEWFIEDLVNEEDKEKARSAKLTSREVVLFKCSKGHQYSQQVDHHICIKNGTRRYGCPLCVKGNYRSKTELEIESFIKDLGFCVDHRMFKNPNKGFFEIDIFIPEKNIGIEYNGSYWHKTLPDLKYSKDRLYHQKKYLTCQQLGIRLISIFEPDWRDRKEKVKQYLKDLLLPVQTRIYARKTEVKKIDYHTANSLYDKYHLLGKTTIQAVSYGLYYNNELLACMSFQKGRYKENKEPVWCLTRFVTVSGYSIVGGASKLLTQFEKEYTPTKLVSYSDNDYFNGGVYSKLGFKNNGCTHSPRYYWWLEDREIKREKAQLHKLEKKFPELYQESLSVEGNREDYIMLHAGAWKVYRAGHTKWEKEYGSGNKD